MKNNSPAITSRAQSVRPLFSPSRLKLIREVRMMKKKDLAQAVGVSPAAITQFENRASIPSVSTLLQLAMVLDVPVDFFKERETFGLQEMGLSLREPTSFSLDECHFRSLKSATQAQKRQVLGLGSMASSMMHILEDVFEIELPQPSLLELQKEGSKVKTMEDIENLATTVRRRLLADVYGEQYLFSPLGFRLIPILESRGVRFLVLNGHGREIDAFSTMKENPWVFLSSVKEVGSRISFNVAHEFGHILLHQDVSEPIYHYNKKMEDEANAFAAALLMPKEALRKQFPHRMGRSAWQLLLVLKQKWGVSLAALLRRARDLKCISPEAYSRACIALVKRGWRTEEPGEDEFRKKLVMPALVEQVITELQKTKGIGKEEILHALSIREQDLKNLIHFELPSSKAKKPINNEIPVENLLTFQPRA